MNKYLALQAWNLYLSGPRMWNVDTAIREVAPADSIYRAHSGQWVTLQALAPGHQFHAFYLECVNGGHVR